MAEGLAKKKRIRAGHRASTTRALTKVNDALAAETADEAKLSQLKLTLEEKLGTLKLLDSEIVELTEEDSLTTEIEQADDYKSEIYAALVRIDKALKLTTPPVPPTPVSTHEITSARAPEPSVRLPKLSMKPFNGDITQWTTFWDSFKSAIHENPALSDIDKFNYLRSLLERSARESIAGLTLTAPNYKEAVSILEKRFGNTQQIISRHMDLLLNLEPVSAAHQLRNLRRLYDSVETHVRSLKSLGVDSKTYGTLLASVLLNKLPQELRLIVSRKTGDVGLDQLLKEVEQEIDARERAQATQPNPGHPPRKPREPPHTAATLLSGNPLATCCYCQQQHAAEACATVKGIEDRKQILRKSGRCFVCLRRGHISRECRSRSRCHKCSARHHVSVCTQVPTNEGSVALPVTTPAPGTGLTPNSDAESLSRTALNPEAPSFQVPTSTLYIGTSKNAFLQTAQVVLYNLEKPCSTLKVRAVLDTGSQRSYATDAVKKALHLESKEMQQLSIATFGTTAQDPRGYGVVHVGLKLKDGGKRELRMITVPSICEPLTAQPISLCLGKFEHLKQLDLADYSDGQDSLQIDVLIGADYYWELVTGRTSRCDSGPVAVHTRLGWVLSGPIPKMKRSKCSTTLLTTHTLHVGTALNETETLNETLHSFWELESLGVRQPDQCVLTEFEEKIKLKNGRYQVSLPWKDVHSPLPDNYQLALKRLRGLRHRLLQQPALLKEYDAIIQDQVKQGIVEVITDPTPTDGRVVHYLPHHAVVRQDKATTKMRIVYDASARTTGPSLNDCLYTGPKFDQRILDILLRFRTSKIALTADIERAFLQICVDERDQDVLRFLWFDDIAKPQPEVQILKFTRVVFGVSSSPFLLNATIRHHLKKYMSAHPQLVKRISESIYVDDVVSGAETEGEAFIMYQESKAMLRKGGFNLRKFNTNSPELRELIHREENAGCPSPAATHHSDETYSKTVLGGAQSIPAGEQKTLGVRWCVETDHFVLDVSEVGCQARSLSPTKRNIVSIVGRIYDPLGFLSPVLIRLKCLFQELCELKLEWDEPLTGAPLSKWESMVADLQADQQIHVPRYLLCDVHHQVDSYSLIGFCDASKKAYAAVVYLRMKTQEGFHVKFLTSKTRVNPLQPQTIPRLELLSALLLTRLLVSVRKGLESRLSLSETTCYTDSKVALHWIRGAEKEWKQFIQNRTTEIRTLLPDAIWVHCAGKDNPADLPSRGMSLAQLAASDLWKKGPDWLTSGGLGACQEEESMPEECVQELKAKERRLLHSLVVVEPTTRIGQLIQCESFSSAQRLLRVTAYALLAAEKFKKKLRETTAPTVPLLCKAETLWVKEAQTHLMKCTQFNNWKRQLGLFLDPEGVWRCGGRLSNADFPYMTRHPILLPRDHPLTKLLVLKAHARVFHNGIKETLTEVRAKYWILKGRSLVKRILHKCLVCKRFEGRPYSAPVPPPLPDFRVQRDSPFASTGVDFAGPLYVKATSKSKSTKVWICLYTCCTVRAVHLDLVPDLTTSSFLRSLKRFAARRGLPRRIVSDNGKTFKAAAKAIQVIVKSREVQEHLTGLGVEWKFNVERAPWWGGIFERMVRSTKRCLKKTIGRARLTYDELLTSLIEVEMVINSRPLTYVSPDDLQEPLTPAHFLTGKRILSLPDGICCGDDPDDEDVDLARDHLTRRMKYLNTVLNHFWKRWQLEYLLDLRESHRQRNASSNRDDATTINTGDVVLLQEEKPRAFWRLARVKQLITGRDGRVRAAMLAVPSGDGQTSTFRRPIQLLYPLESDVKTNSGNQASETGPTVSQPTSLTQDPPEGTRARPKRAAALKAKKRLSELDY